MFEVPSPQAPPYAAICYIRCDWADGSSSRASGVVVGVNDVLTALHAIYDAEHGGWAESISISPGADTSPFLNQPFGVFSDVGSLVGRASNWDLDGDGLLTQQESRGDIALIGMNSRIGDVSGWLPVGQVANDFFGVMAGFPARGSGMMIETAYADALTGVYEINSSLGAGASGGPLLYTSGDVTSVAGVLSSGNFEGTRSTYAGLFETATWNWLQGAMETNNSLLGQLPGSTPIAGGTLFTGSAAADTLTGTSGRDTFVGNGGNDTLDGAGGLDLAIYAGARSDHVVTVTTGAIEVRDLLAGRNGTDIIRNIERVAFDDVSIAFDVDGSAGQAWRLFQAAFDRRPDQAGLGYQMKALDDGLPLSLVATHFIQSPEFQLTYGDLNDAAFVTQLYANVLDRAPDTGGFNFHTANLASGTTRADVLVGFSESPENKAALIGVMQDGMTFTI